jgi:hypothetical protein
LRAAPPLAILRAPGAAPRAKGGPA